MLKVVENKKIFFSISAAIIILGLIFYFVNGFNFGVDFTGGTNLHLDLGQQYEISDIDGIVKSVVSDAAPTIVKGGEQGTEVMITIKELTDEEGMQLLKALREKYDPSYSADEVEAPAEEAPAEELTEAPAEEAPAGEATEAPAEEAESAFKIFTRDTVSATVGNELKRSAALSSVLAIILMLVYISFRFEFWSGVAAVISLIHNVLILLSVYTIFKLPINATFIAALLTIVGYSINDTIVIFDRIRENNRYAKKTPFSEVVNKSVTQSLTRSINTSVTTLLSILILYIIGVASIKQFALPIIIGIIVGTYSSLTIASPIWHLFKGDKN